ncbi:class A beta-lactamase [Chitinophaga vietnamensis]|uniref:class A beta-lactamase n=1 Tax=Chitinophaga vietnamensis TaxID=2593957 RepID=UPI001178A659|nr:class A beta-lactamase [Chitinophaga vietnamensis]
MKKICLFPLVISSITTFAQQSLQARLQEVAATIKGKTGVYAEVLETGDTASLHATTHYPMQSVYKFPIALAILQEVDKGRLRLDQPVQIRKSVLTLHGHSPIRDSFPEGTTMPLREVLRYNTCESDGTACDVLLGLLGGTRNAEKAIHALGVRDIAIATTEKVQMEDELVQYRNWCTPAAMAQLLRIFYTKNILSPASKALLIKDMTETPVGLKRLKGELPPGTTVVHKTGTSNTVQGLTRATNDVGIITLPNGKHLAIAVFVSDAYGSTAEREGIIAQMARLCFDAFTSR